MLDLASPTWTFTCCIFLCNFYINMVGKQIAAKGMERSLMLSAEKMHGTTCNAPLERDSSGRLVSQTSIRHTSHRLPQRLPSCAEAEDDDGLYIGSCSSPHRLRSTKGSTTRFTTLRNSEPHLQALQSSSLRMAHWPVHSKWRADSPKFLQ